MGDNNMRPRAVAFPLQQFNPAPRLTKIMPGRECAAKDLTSSWKVNAAHLPGARKRDSSVVRNGARKSGRARGVKL